MSSNPPTGRGYIFDEKVGSTRIKIKILIGKVMTGRPSSKIKIKKLKINHLKDKSAQFMSTICIYIHMSHLHTTLKKFGENTSSEIRMFTGALWQLQTIFFGDFVVNIEL